MKLLFYKYQGTANDFILLDNFDEQYNGLSIEQRAFLCHRRWGIGADGLILLNRKEGFDFEMKYYNADGRESSMCGNGGRCITAFAFDRGIKKERYTFWAADGNHESVKQQSIVRLKMKDVFHIEELEHNVFVLDTGSPHYVTFVENVKELNIDYEGDRICQTFPEGINVNFVQNKDEYDLVVCTYERGVFAETWSCGTGSVACALVQAFRKNIKIPINVYTRGGKLEISYEKKSNQFVNIWLSGNAQKVYEGEIEI
ncbi:MAG: diaminopimelate epimerase [Chitinophagaceae bacterium]